MTVSFMSINERAICREREVDAVQKIKNPNYRKFLDEGTIDTIDEKALRLALNNITGNHTKQGRALLIALYYTGARPNELLRLQAGDVSQEGRYVTIQLKGSKRGLPRKLHIKKNDLMEELYQYAVLFPPTIFLFYSYSNEYTRTSINVKGEVKQRVERSDRLRFWVKKWFTGIVPNSITTYFLRHNRFSKMAMKDATMEDIRFWKGGRTLNSVAPYIHMSTAKSKKISKKVD
jgi:integrase